MQSLVDLGPVAFVWRGGWNSTAEDYTINNVVRHNGTLYIGVREAIPAGDFPGISLAWDEFLQPSPSSYELCEFYYFRNPALRKGFQRAYGEVIEHAAMRYPEAWAYLQTAEGQAMCVSENEWQAMSVATWATLADGSTVGWEGVGGVPFFVPVRDAGSLRLPDLRGMYAEAAGFDSLGVGGVHGDGIREIEGRIFTGTTNASGIAMSGTGAFGDPTSYATTTSGNGVGNNPRSTKFMASRVVPTANQNQPRAWGALPCVYLGYPSIAG